MSALVAIIIIVVIVGNIGTFFDENGRAIALIAGTVVALILIVRAVKKSAARKAAEEAERIATEQKEKARREAMEKEKEMARLKSEAEKAASEKKEKSDSDFVEVPYEINGCPCAYNYEKVYFDLLPGVDPAPYLGRKVRLYDLNGEILVKVGKTQIGTMRDNRLSDMVSDWLDRGDPIYAVVTHTNDDPHECAFDLFFYRKDDLSDN